MGHQPVHALREASLSIASGDYLSLMGPSGSGKSTLLHILGLLDRPTEGEYRFEGRSTQDLSDGERSLLRRYKVGFVFQFFHLLPRLDALGNVELPMMLAGVAKADRRERAKEVLDKVGLAARAAHKPEELRRAPARGHRPGHRDAPDDGAGRRTHRQPGPRVGRRDHPPA